MLIVFEADDIIVEFEVDKIVADCFVVGLLVEEIKPVLEELVLAESKVDVSFAHFHLIIYH
jgi:hypothetical protein